MNTVFEVCNLQKTFGGLHVTNNVSLSLRSGERVALIGPNGAGKTTFVNLVTGGLKPSGGSISLNGSDVSNKGAIERVHLGLVQSFQVTRLFSDMTPQEHVALAILQREGLTNSVFMNYLTMPDILEETIKWLSDLGISDLAEFKVREIAYGQQRLLEMAIALALKPKVLLLDEPAAGVHHSDIHRIELALAQLPPDLAVLMIEHDMDLVFRFAKRVIVLAAGEIIFDGTPENVVKDVAVRQAYLGSYADDRSVA